MWHNNIQFYHNPYTDADDVISSANRFFKKYLKRLDNCEKWLKAVNPEHYYQYLDGRDSNSKFGEAEIHFIPNHQKHLDF